MKNFIFLPIVFLFVLNSCNNSNQIDKFLELQKEIDSLRVENNNLKLKNIRLETSLDSLKNKNKAGKKGFKLTDNTNNKSIKYYSDAEAIQYVKDYYNFYNSGYVVRNIRVRRISNNKFSVALEEENKSLLGIKQNIADTRGEEMIWDSSNYTLTIFNTKEYTLKRN